MYVLTKQGNKLDGPLFWYFSLLDSIHFGCKITNFLINTLRDITFLCEHYKTQGRYVLVLLVHIKTPDQNGQRLRVTTPSSGAGGQEGFILLILPSWKQFNHLQTSMTEQPVITACKLLLGTNVACVETLKMNGLLSLKTGRVRKIFHTDRLWYSTHQHWWPPAIRAW